MSDSMQKKIVFVYWKDRVPHRFWAGRNASLLNKRSWGVVIGKRFFTLELHGWGPTP